jgi:Pyruvate/2-oxoacid:ferredoxin oxidoreductase delta subunit
MELLLSLTVPLVAATIAWFANERQKRRAEEYARKEDSYRALVRASRGYYVGAENREQKNLFLEQVDLCWLYCPDEVIRRAYAFLETVKTGAQSTEAERNRTFGDFLVAIRKDLLERRVTRQTSLMASDHRIFLSR